MLNLLDTSHCFNETFHLVKGKEVLDTRCTCKVPSSGVADLLIGILRRMFCDEICRDAMAMTNTIDEERLARGVLKVLQSLWTKLCDRIF